MASDQMTSPEPLLVAVLSAKSLKQAWELVQAHWNEVTPGFVDAVFRESHLRDQAGDRAAALDLLRLCWLIGRRQGNARVMARSLFNAASKLRDSEPVRAADLFRQSLAHWRDFPDEQARRSVADCHHELGNIHLAYIVDLSQATEHYRTALEMYEALADTRGIADALGGLGNVLRYQGDLKGAINHVQRAVTLARSLDDPLVVAGKLNNLGLCLNMAGDVEGAIACYQEVLQLMESSGDPQILASALGNLGGALMGSGRLAEARTILDRGLNLARANQLQREEAHLLSLVGAVLVYAGDVDAAEHALRQALAAFEALGDPLVATGVLTNLGLVAQTREQLDHALAYYREALVRYQKKGEQQGQAQVLCNLGAIHDELGQAEEARRCFEEALEICRRIGYRQGQATALGGLGLIHLDVGHYEAARDVYREALGINQEIGYRRGVAINHSNLGLIAFRARNLEEAVERYRAALAESRAIADADGEATALQMLGRIYLEQGAYREAQGSYRQAGIVAERHGLDRIRRELHNDEARMLASMGKLEDAFEHLRSALAVQERVRAELSAEAYRLSYLETTGGAYQNIVWLCLELAGKNRLCDGRSCLATVLEYVEQSRSRTLIDALARQPLPLRAAVPSELIEQERGALSALQSATLQMVAGHEPLASRGEIERQGRALQNVWQQMVRYVPEYVALRRGEAIGYQFLQRCLLI